MIAVGSYAASGARSNALGASVACSDGPSVTIGSIAVSSASGVSACASVAVNPAAAAAAIKSARVVNMPCRPSEALPQTETQKRPGAVKEELIAQLNF